MFRLIKEFGDYLLLMRQVFSLPDRFVIFKIKLISEMYKIGLDSVFIIALISMAMGAGVVIQMATNMSSPFLPEYIIGYATRESIVLEFSSSVVALILAGKVGSNIASEIGTMRISEQIDALDIMGVNSANFLILPKVVAAVIFFPLLSSLSMMFGLFGGYLITVVTEIIPSYEYTLGLKAHLDMFYIIYSLTKAAVFGFLITTISGYYGYFAKGNSLEVGRNSTRAVVVSSVMILVFNLILTQLMIVK